MQKIFSGALLLIVVVIGLWVWGSNSNLSEAIVQYVQNSDILTLEAKYTPEEIMNTHRDELLVDSSHSYLEPSLKFHPHLLIESKYLVNQKTREGVLLWSLVDGEIVIDTDTWDKTHGFQDALLVDASRNEFLLLNALAKHNGVMTKERLKKELSFDMGIVELWINSACNKHLIIQKGNLLFLHFENPKILISPQTKLSQAIVTKPYHFEQKLSKRFSKKQIEKMSKAAFGTDFIIRNMREVCLPVFCIEVLNPDGSLQTSYWNGVTGERIAKKFLL